VTSDDAHLNTINLWDSLLVSLDVAVKIASQPALRDETRTAYLLLSGAFL
jgi:hypothetical protein